MNPSVQIAFVVCLVAAASARSILPVYDVLDIEGGKYYDDIVDVPLEKSIFELYPHSYYSFWYPFARSYSYYPYHLKALFGQYGYGYPHYFHQGYGYGYPYYSLNKYFGNFYGYGKYFPYFGMNKYFGDFYRYGKTFPYYFGDYYRYFKGFPYYYGKFPYTFNYGYGYDYPFYY